MSIAERGKYQCSECKRKSLVNVYRGTGKILFSPTITGTEMNTNNSAQQTTGTKGIGDAISKALS